MTFRIAIPRPRVELVDGGLATWVGPELVPRRHVGFDVMVGRGSIVRFLTRCLDGWSCTVAPANHRGRVRLHFVPAAWLCPMVRG